MFLKIHQSMLFLKHFHTPFLIPEKNNFTTSYCEGKPEVKKLIDVFCSPQRRHYCQFLLDCSVLPEVINAVQLHGQDILHHLFTISRMWCFALHRDRLKLLGRWSTFKHYQSETMKTSQDMSAGTCRLKGPQPKFSHCCGCFYIIKYQNL